MFWLERAFMWLFRHQVSTVSVTSKRVNISKNVAFFRWQGNDMQQKSSKQGCCCYVICNSTNPLFEADLLCVNLGLYWLSYHFFHWCFLMFWTPVHFWLWRSPAVPFISMAFLYPKCQSHRTWTKNVHLSRTSARKSHLASQPAAYRK